MCQNIREKLLLRQGFSPKDISQATIDVMKAKLDRMISSQHIGRMMMMLRQKDSLISPQQATPQQAK
jgi:hypothetical protein